MRRHCVGTIQYHWPEGTCTAIERYERWRGFIASTLAYLAIALSIALFVFRVHVKAA